MDLQLVNKGLEYTRKRKKWVFLVAALGFSCYGAYRVYHLPSVIKKRKRLLKLLATLVTIAEVVADSAEAIGVVSKDLNEFIQSDSDKIPNSLIQISKLTRSEEFSESVSGITRALAVGILRGYQSEQAGNTDSVSGGSSSLTDQVFDKLLSTAGSGFASVVVGSFARNLVRAFYSDSNGNPKLNGSASSVRFHTESHTVSRWVDIVCDEKCRNLIGDSIQLFVSTAVAAYLDKTMDINTYEEIFEGLTNPKHETEVREMLASICNGAIETFVRTSHQVLTSTNSNVDSNSGSSGLAIDLRDGWSDAKGNLDGQESIPTEWTRMKSSDENQDAGWVNKMSSTLAVPSNRRFVLDMTGRVTFETVRSILEFLLEKLSEGLRNNLNVVHDEVIDRGLEAFRYVTAKSSAIATICLSLCLHILSGPWILVPA